MKAETQEKNLTQKIISSKEELNRNGHFNSIFDRFTRQYSLSKTLRFELVPVGETEKFIKENRVFDQQRQEKISLIERDNIRAAHYKDVKKLIDEYHKKFIDEVLKNVKLENLTGIFDEFEKDRKSIEKYSDKLRKFISDKFKKHPDYESLFGDDLFKEKLPLFIKGEGREQVIKLWKKRHEEFANAEDDVVINDALIKVKTFYNDEAKPKVKFTTYFSGFHTNRENMYEAKEQSTAIAYRIVNDNLPKFFDNLMAYEKLTKLENPALDFTDAERLLNQGETLEDVFKADYFNNCLTQNGITHYNTILGGMTEIAADEKAKGINELVNKYRQDNKSVSQSAAPFLTGLYKQILSDRETKSFQPEKYKSVSEMIGKIREYETKFDEFTTAGGDEINLIEYLEKSFPDVLIKLNHKELNQIFIRNASLADMSHAMFKDIFEGDKVINPYAVLKNALAHGFEINWKPRQKKNKKDGVQGDKAGLDEAFREYFKQTYFSLARVENDLKIYLNHLLAGQKENKKLTEFIKQGDWHPLVDYFTAFNATVEDWKKDEKGKYIHDRVVKNVIEDFNKKKGAAQSALKTYAKNPSQRFEGTADEKRSIKEYLDSIKQIYWFLFPLFVKPPRKDGKTKRKDELEAYLNKHESFYAEFDLVFEPLNKPLTELYDKVRNFLTQKQYAEEKIKLNFENVQLLGGWDTDKEVDYTCTIFRNDRCYYLGIMDKSDRAVFENLQDVKNGEPSYEKMVYKQLGDISRQLPRIAFSEAWRQKLVEDNILNQEVIDIYEKDLFKDDVSACHKLMCFYKTFIEKHENWNKYFDFSFSDISKHKNLSDFYSDVDAQFYNLSFSENVSESYINQLVSEGKLYLFWIYNKDFSPNSNGKNKNLHTLYWNAVFDKINLGNVVYQLNGKAEVFFREKSLKHSDEKMQKGFHHELRKGKHPIIKDKRFTKDKYLFHVPITLNFGRDRVPGENDRKKAFAYNFNKTVNAEINKGFPDINIIGIDRGEKHLAYYTIINSNREIIRDKDGKVLQGSFNKIEETNNYKNKTTDYHSKLTKREDERDAARKSWDTIGKIKELKEGYLSQVVHKIAKLMIEHNAIVVFEDLNFGFKRGRMKVERQVYQKLEKMLIDKLNYLVFKDYDAEKPGGVLNAYQLAAPFTSFRDMGKQTGFIYYIPAANTSKIDFATGFVNFLYPKIEDAENFFQKFECIRFNPDKNYFEFIARYNNFVKDDDAKLHDKFNEPWTICTHGDLRFQYQPSSKSFRDVNVTVELQDLFLKHNIPYADGKDLRIEIKEKSNTTFYKGLISLLRLVLQMRYTDGKERDFILSPVADNKGVFFNSENAKETEPQNADANGAYHIALKGLLLLEWITGKRKKEVKEGKKKKDGPDLFISNKEWMEFVQGRTNS